jgi:hypothetical protein
MNPARKRASFPIFFLVFLAVIVIYPAYGDELAVSTSAPSYGPGATIRVLGMLTLRGSPVLDGLVAVQVQDSLKNTRFVRVVKTGTPPEPWMVRISSFTSCDFQGNPSSSFRQGTNAYFEITVESIDYVNERDVTVALDLFDPIGTSLSVQYSKFSLGPAKRFTIVTSMPIPADSYVGSAVCCASILTDFPRENGYPYCEEKYVEFTITGSGPQVPSGSSDLSAIGANGSYSLSFKLPDGSKIGEYVVSARGRYNAAAGITFDYYWIPTDVNRDAIVNILDISFVAKAFHTRVGDLNYDQVADINNDNVVDIVDISRVAADFGKKKTGA